MKFLKGKSKGKGGKGDKGDKSINGKKGRNARVRDPRPQELMNFSSKTKSGKPFCFAYNLAGCNARGVERCNRGEHVCMRCEGSHGQRECPIR